MGEILILSDLLRFRFKVNKPTDLRKGPNMQTPVLQLVIGHTPEDTMAAAAKLQVPMANSLEHLFNANGIQLLPPNGQHRSGYDRRLRKITELLQTNPTGVYVVWDRKAGESLQVLAMRQNWPANIWDFLNVIEV